MTRVDEALLAVIRARTGRAELAFARPPKKLSGGFWAEIFSFSLADPPSDFAGDLILRRMPDQNRARIEVAVQSAASESGFPTPRVRLSGGPDAGLERAFMIMDRAKGTTLERSRSRIEGIRRFVGFARLCAEVQLRLHSLPRESLERVTRHGVEPRELSVAAMLAEMRAIVSRLKHDELSAAVDWLEKTRPPERRLVLCHCDVNPNNVIVDGDGAWSAIDWTTARVAEPELDVACSAEMFVQLGIPTPRALRPVVEWLGGLAASHLKSVYRSRAPLDAKRVTWYQALVRAHMLVFLNGCRARLPGSWDPPPNWLIAEPSAMARLRAAMRS